MIVLNKYQMVLLGSDQEDGIAENEHQGCKYSGRCAYVLDTSYSVECSCLVTKRVTEFDYLTDMRYLWIGSEGKRVLRSRCLLC